VLILIIGVEVIIDQSETGLQTIELKLYETFCRFFNMSPMEMIHEYGERIEKK
jgi:hypothetical protein